ncbi:MULTISPECIES: hypothetical protein [Vibrio]|uniref:hypothetical protein n=1 Tax=Vibrio TaxID=662 RepID=UPI002240703C|nr:MULTISPECIES: hypothetical protein [Vibrio]MDL1993305.1 hypothetical protein [Vibrio parahaemolyticus]MDW1465441.1 hypothetical protein [Vibrio sp. YT-16]MDW1950146.1 hypothetical protein [Vibrio sp. 812(2023)]MDW2254880.1 hypothetical protein [Vibrio sp. 1569]
MTTLFYFSDINELNQFESFTVEPLVNDHANIGLAEGEPKGWSVIGKLKPENVKALTSDKFPVADFQHEAHAGVFANLCESHISK